MFQLRLFYDKKYKEEKYLEAMAINCINCNKNAGLCIKNRTIEGIITKICVKFNIASFGYVVDNLLQQ